MGQCRSEPDEPRREIEPANAAPLGRTTELRAQLANQTIESLPEGLPVLVEIEVHVVGHNESHVAAAHALIA